MKRSLSKTAYTLIELIVSMALVSIVILGMFSVNMVLSNNNQDYGQRYLVRSETQTTLNHILNDASLAAGSGTSVGSPSEPDLGIVSVATGNLNQAFCIHQRPTSTTDTWACYELDLTSADAAYHQIWYCSASYNLTTATRGATAAAAAACLTSGTFLGTAHSATTTFSLTANGPFAITIQNCLNDSATSCFNANSALQDPVNNPQVTLSGTVYPSDGND